MLLIAVVMGSETSAQRFTACKQLLDWGFANFALVSPQTQSATVPVELGVRDTVEVLPAEAPQLLIDKSQKSAVTTEVALEESAAAPVSKGQRLGTMTVRCGDQILRQIPMVAAQSVEKLSWWQMFVRVLRRVAMAG